MSTIKQELAFYRDEGFNVIALKQREKTPDFRKIPSWEPYQSRLSTPEERELWWPGNPGPDEPFANIAVVTGPISGQLVVIDLDNEDAYRALWEAPDLTGQTLCETATVETGKGFHLYLRVPAGCGPIFTVTHPDAEGLHHIKATGGYVVAPPSIHPSGRVYQWVNRDIQNWSLDALVAQLLAAGFLRKEEREVAEEGVGGWGDRFAEIVNEGGRADTVSRLAGFLRGPLTSEAVTRELMRSWNRDHCKPPLQDHEVDAIVKSMYRRYRSWEEENNEPE